MVYKDSVSDYLGFNIYRFDKIENCNVLKEEEREDIGLNFLYDTKAFLIQEQNKTYIFGCRQDTECYGFRVSKHKLKDYKSIFEILDYYNKLAFEM